MSHTWPCTEYLFTYQEKTVPMKTVHLCRYYDSPMRMADSRSLLTSLPGLVSDLQPSLCPCRYEGAGGGGRGGGGGPGGGGTGGSGKPGPTCKAPLCGGGCAWRGKPKAVWADGMGGPGAGSGVPELFESKRNDIMLETEKLHNS